MKTSNSNFHVVCTQTYMQNFGQILCRRASTKRHMTSRAMVRFSQTWYQKMRKTWKKKLMKSHVARQSRISHGGGGSNDPPLSSDRVNPKVNMYLYGTYNLKVSIKLFIIPMNVQHVAHLFQKIMKVYV